jgi:hypothetical protein
LGFFGVFLIFEGRIMHCGRGTINRCIGPDRDRNRYREIAAAGMGYLAASPRGVGAKDDPRAAVLYRAALASFALKRARKPQ